MPRSDILVDGDNKTIMSEVHGPANQRAVVVVGVFGRSIYGFYSEMTVQIKM
jgi:hypothetical protein